MSSSILESISGVFSFIIKGLGGLIDFFLNLPNFIYNLVKVIPEPFQSIIEYFVGFIILLILISLVGKIVSTIKGG